MNETVKMERKRKKPEKRTIEGRLREGDSKLENGRGDDDRFKSEKARAICFK